MKRMLFRILVLGLGALLLIAQTESLARIFHEKCARRAETAALAFARAALRG